MKKRSDLIPILLPVIITTGLYVVFYSKIESTPGNAGFWFILALGISIGVALTRIIQWQKTRNDH